MSNLDTTRPSHYDMLTPDMEPGCSGEIRARYHYISRKESTQGQGYQGLQCDSDIIVGISIINTY